MKVLVTGATSRQANPEASDVGKKEVAFAWLLAEALRGNGYEVEHRNPSVVEDFAEFDHVFLGLAPLHGLGSNRAYGVLAAALRTWGTGRLSFFVDDPNVGNVTGGLRTMATEPDRLVKPFFAYKLEYEAASKPEVAQWLQAGVKMLHEQEWPRLLMPGHTWFTDHAVLEKKIPQAVGRIEAIDLTAFLPEVDLTTLEVEETPQQHWICEAGPDDKWLRQQRPTFAVHRIGKDGDKKLPDRHLVAAYKSNWGVLQPPIVPPGWWSSRIGYARQAETLYVTRWQDVAVLGDAYTVLPDRVEALSLEEREELVVDQALALDERTATKESIFSQLRRVVESVPVGATK